MMDTNMEDVGRAPADVSPVQSEPASIPTLDGWIESLMNCKQLSEFDVQRLCDKVGCYLPDEVPGVNREWPGTAGCFLGTAMPAFALGCSSRPRGGWLFRKGVTRLQVLR